MYKSKMVDKLMMYTRFYLKPNFIPRVTIFLLSIFFVNSYTCCYVSALLREPQRRSPSARPQLEIYSASGGTLGSFPVNIDVKDGPL